MNCIHQLSVICEEAASPKVSAIAQAYGVAGSNFVPQCQLTANGSTTTHRGMTTPITEEMRLGLLSVSANPENLSGVYYLIVPNSDSGEVAGSNIPDWVVDESFDFDDLRKKLLLERIDIKLGAS